MVEGTETAWLTVLEKKRVASSAEILENYGIDSETDLSVLDQGYTTEKWLLSAEKWLLRQLTFGCCGSH